MKEGGNDDGEHFSDGYIQSLMGHRIGSSDMDNWKLCKHVMYDLLHLVIIDDEIIKIYKELIVLRDKFHIHG